MVDIDIFYLPPPAKTKPGPSILKIKQHRPWLCPLLIVLTLVITGGTTLSLCRQSTQSLDHSLRTLLDQRLQELQESDQVNASLKQQNTSLVAQNQELQNKMATVMQTAQVDQQTYAKVLQSLSQLQEEQQKLTEELTFYKKLLISPTATAENVEVSRLSLSYVKDQRKYSYKLVLTRFAWEAIVNEGSVQIEIMGKVETKRKRLSMKQITDPSLSSQPYEVLYFQRLEGYLKLPKEFSPESVVVRILPKGQTKANEMTFKWSELQEQAEDVGKS